MAYAHIAHDCEIGDEVILSNTVQVAGHSTIEHHVIIGGVTGVHQFSKIGQYSMVGACKMVSMDVPPYVLASGYPIRFEGLNSVGLRRRGFPKEAIATLKDIYNILYSSGLTFTKARDKIAENYIDNFYAQNVLEFIKKSDRGIIRK